METDLLTAAREGNLSALSALIPAPARQLNARDAGRCTPLMLAALGGHTEAVRLLLEAGADVKLRNGDGHTALLLALCGASEEMVRLLLEAGSPVEHPDHLPMDFAVRFGTPGMVRMLLERGVPADPKPDGHLVDAIGRGNEEVVRLLLEHGADPHSVPQCGTALVAAIASRRDSLAELFLQLGGPLRGALIAAIQAMKPRLALRLLALGADPNERGLMGETPLQTAAEMGSVLLLRRLVGAGAALETAGGMLGQTALHRAVSEEERASARALLELGANPNVVDEFGQSPLQEAAAGGDARMVELLLRHGAQANPRRRSQPTPLHAAVAAGEAETARVLLEAGADPNARIGPQAAEEMNDVTPGATAVHLAAASGSKQLVELLLSGGARADLLDKKGVSAADRAARAGHHALAERLRAAGSPLSVDPQHAADAWLRRAVRVGDEEGVRQALAAGGNAGALDPETGTPPLVTAAQEGLAGAVRLLLEHGAEVDRGTAWGLSPLGCAVVRGHLDVVRLLLERGADPNAAYAQGYVPAGEENTVLPSSGSPLADAAHGGGLELVELLLAAGADPNGAAGEPAPLTAAVLGRRFDVARRLREAGAVPCPGDADFLAMEEWEARAADPEFLHLAAELDARCGPAELNEGLPGVRFYRFSAEQELPPIHDDGDAAAAGREWGRRFSENLASLQGAVDGMLQDLGERTRRAGFLLLDAGSPLGCGPMTQFLALVPESDPFAVMAAWGLRANDDELPTRELIRRFRQLREEEPWDLVGIRFDTAVIRFRRDLPDPLARARQLCGWCSDLGKAKGVAERIRASRTVHFWWD